MHKRITDIKARGRQAGMTLVELMVAMALGAFLIAGVVNVFLANKDSSQIETSLARLQENGRIALDLLVADLRDVYYMGCSSFRRRPPNIIANNPPINWSFLNGFEKPGASLQPTGGVVATNLDAAIGNARTGSDVVYLSNGRRLLTATAADVFSASTTVPVTSNLECIQASETLIIASCSAAVMFRVTNNDANCDGTAHTFDFDLTGNSVNSLGTDFPAGTELMQTFEKTWFVADTLRRRTPANIPVTALFRRTNGVNEEMVEGVEYMQLLYGVDMGLGQLRYVPANNGSLSFDNDEIIAVRVALLMQSYEPVLDAPDTRVYQVADEQIGAAGTTFTHNGDLTMRRVFQTTVLLKN
ncbi:MAG: PilW family protein [Halieaceae bacterium]|nr:PilW family protein [Halieaceae bacterium]